MSNFYQVHELVRWQGADWRIAVIDRYLGLATLVRLDDPGVTTEVGMAELAFEEGQQ